jgi:hypothetical protein
MMDTYHPALVVPPVACHNDPQLVGDHRPGISAMRDMARRGEFKVLCVYTYKTCIALSKKVFVIWWFGIYIA